MSSESLALSGVEWVETSLAIPLVSVVLIERQAFGAYNAKQCAQNQCKSKTLSMANLLSLLAVDISTTSSRPRANPIRKWPTATRTMSILRLPRRRRHFAIGQQNRQR